MKLDKAMELAKQFPQSVLATHKRDGRAQLSNVLHVPWDDGTLRISVTDDRAKTKNLRRDPRCELYIRDDSFWKYLVLECEAEVRRSVIERDQKSEPTAITAQATEGDERLTGPTNRRRVRGGRIRATGVGYGVGTRGFEHRLEPHKSRRGLIPAIVADG